MVQHAKAFAVKPGNLRFTPKNHMVERETQLVRRESIQEIQDCLV